MAPRGSGGPRGASRGSNVTWGQLGGVMGLLMNYWAYLPIYIQDISKNLCTIKFFAFGPFLVFCPPFTILDTLHKVSTKPKNQDGQYHDESPHHPHHHDQWRLLGCTKAHGCPSVRRCHASQYILNHNEASQYCCNEEEDNDDDSFEMMGNSLFGDYRVSLKSYFKWPKHFLFKSMFPCPQKDISVQIDLYFLGHRCNRREGRRIGFQSTNNWKLWSAATEF